MTTTQVPEATPVPPPDGALPRKISTLGGLALAISNVGPTISVGIGLGVLAAAVGSQMPIVFVLAFLPMFGIAVAYTYLNRREPNCGTAYVWLRRAFSPWVGFLAGWVGIAGSVAFLSYATPLTGQITLANLQGLGLAVNPDSMWQSTLTGLFWLILVTVIAIRGTDVAVKAQLVLVVLEVLIVGAIVGAALIAGDVSPVEASWFDPTQITSPLALATGLVLAVYVFWGWDSAFSVTEETASPRDASKAGLLTLVAVLAMFVISAIGFQRAMTQEELTTHGALGLVYLGGKLLGTAGQAAAGLAMLMSSVAVLQSVVIASARLTLAMGRDGNLGRIWARIHPKYGTPARGTLILGAIALSLTLISMTLGPLLVVITGVVTGIGILVSLSYGTAGLACAWLFRDTWRDDKRTFVMAVVLPTLSGLALFGLGAALMASQQASTDHFELDPANGWFLNALPVGILLLGLVLAAWTRFRRRSPYFTDPNFVSPTSADETRLALTEGAR